MNMKVCTRCKELKQIKEYRNGYSICKKCSIKKDKETLINKYNNSTIIKCTICGIVKNKSEFSKNRFQCRSCRKNKRRQKYESFINLNEAVCYICGENKNINEFNSNFHCKSCSHKRYKKYRKKTNKKILTPETKLAKYLLRGIKSRDKNCTLSVKDVENVLPKNNICPLLGIKLKKNNDYIKDDSFTVDRIDSKKLYVQKNILVISKRANISKNNSTIDEYKTIVDNLEKIFNKKLIIEGNGPIAHNVIKRRISRIKKKCKKDNLPFNLTEEYLKKIYPKNGKCPLLNIDMFTNKKYPGPNSPSVDKIIPIRGYVEGNIMWISHKANTIKSNLSIEEMKMLLNNWKKIIIRI